MRDPNPCTLEALWELALPLGAAPREPWMGRFVRRIGPMIHSVATRAVRRCLPSLDAASTRSRVEDLAQDAFAYLLAERQRVLRSWDRAQGRGLQSYLWFVVQRHIHARMRRSCRDASVEALRELDFASLVEGIEDETCDLHVLAEQRQLLRSLAERMLEHLEPRQLEMVRMCFLEGWGPEEVAEACGVSVRTFTRFRSRFREAALSLRALFLTGFEPLATKRIMDGLRGDERDEGRADPSPEGSAPSRRG
jgi:RNA polymerase sigma factor (sigma-70 family)